MYYFDIKLLKNIFETDDLSIPRYWIYVFLIDKKSMKPIPTQKTYPAIKMSLQHSDDIEMIIRVVQITI